MTLSVAKPSLAVAVLSSDGGEAECIAKAVAVHGWEQVTVPSRAELDRVLRASAFNGIVLGIASLVRLGPADKEFIMGLEPGFPVARVRCQPDGSLVAMSAYTGVTPSLGDFLEVCRVWPRRRMRNAERRKVNLNVVLTGPRGGAGAQGEERTFTLDVSSHGCFLYSTGPWAAGDAVVLAIQETLEPLVIAGTVMRQVPWGTRFHAPGLGIQFDELTEVVRERIRAVVAGNR